MNYSKAPNPPDFTITITLVEILLASWISGVGDVYLPRDPLKGLTDDEIRGLLEKAQISLRRRGFVRVKENEEVILTPLLNGVLNALSRPDAWCHLRKKVSTGSPSELSLISSGDGILTILDCDGHSLVNSHADIGGAQSRVIRFLEISKSVTRDVAGMEWNGSAPLLRELVSLSLLGNGDQCKVLMVENGIEERIASAFAIALTNAISYGSVSCFGGSEGEQELISEFGWLHSPKDYWHIGRSGSRNNGFRIRQVDPVQLKSELWRDISAGLGIHDGRSPNPA